MTKVSKHRWLTNSERSAILRGRQNGMSLMKLASMFNVTKSTISMLIKRFHQTGDISRRHVPGRPRKTTRQVDRSIVMMSRNNPRSTAVDIRAELHQHSVSEVSVETVRRRLRDAGLNGRRPVRKPLISAKNRKARLEFAHRHLNWTVQQWKSVLWSDESKFSLFGSDGMAYVRRPKCSRYLQKYQLPTVKHGGGSVMVWGAFSAKGVSPLHRIEGIMDRHKYIGILQNVMHPFARVSIGRGFIFQQDNDPKHASRDVRNWFACKRINVLQWPSQSPDLNPIEHLWEELSRRLKDKKSKNAAEKFKDLKEEWQRIPQTVLDNLIKSMPRRCQAVIDANGFATKY